MLFPPQSTFPERIKITIVDLHDGCIDHRKDSILFFDDTQGRAGMMVTCQRSNFTG